MRWVVVAMFGCAGLSQAAERVRLSGLPDVDGRSIMIVTRDGIKHSGWRLTTGADSVRLSEKGQEETLPVAEIDRIAVKRGRRFWDITVQGVIFAAGGPAWACQDDHRLKLVACLAFTGAVLGPPGIAFAIATAPVTLSADAVRLLIPPKVYEIVH